MDPSVGNAAESDDLELGALLSRCARHDHQALEELYNRVSPLLLAILVRMLRNRDAAEDALQDVFVRVWLSGAIRGATRACAGLDDQHCPLSRD